MRLFFSTRLLGALGVVLLILSGCEGNGTHYPVIGKVTVDGKPLPDAQLSFLPDVEKGNQTTARSFGKVKDGNYTLTTKAPAGWYKVIILTKYPGGPDKPEMMLPRRYSDYGRSGLSVEVKPNPAPGDYDLKVKSR